MRPILALITTVVVLGSVALYGAFIRSLPPVESNVYKAEHAAGKFTVDLTLTFDAVHDSAFSLDQHSIEVAFQGKKYVVKEAVKAGTPVTLAVEDVRVGENRFHVEVNVADLDFGNRPTTDDRFSLDNPDAPKSSDVTIPARAVRIRVMRDGAPIPGAEQTIWSEPGQKVSGEVLVTVPGSSQPTHDHDAHQ